MIAPMPDPARVSLVDLLTGSLPVGLLERTWPGAVRLVVLDTNVILLSLRRFMRDGTSAMLGAASRGTLRLFAAHHVYWEVLEKLPLVMPGWGFDPAVATAAFGAEFLPWIRFVDVGGVRAADGRDLLVLDLDDRPTAVLLSLLAPAVSISRDPDLVSAGLAFDEWLTPLLAGAQRGKVADMAFTANVGLNLTIAGAGAATSAARRWPTATLLLGIVVVIAGLQLAASGRLQLDRDHLVAELTKLAEAAGQQLDTVVDEARQYGFRLDAATVARVVPPLLHERLARTLALEPRARTHLELAEALSRVGETVAPAEALAVLEGRPFFERQGRWGWLVGRLPCCRHRGARSRNLEELAEWDPCRRRTGGRLSCPSSFAELTSGWAGPGVELGRARLQVAQGRCGVERERIVIVRRHPALNGDGEGEHPHFRPQAGGQLVRAPCAQGGADRPGDPGVLEQSPLLHFGVGRDHQHALGGLGPLPRGHRGIGGRERGLQALGERRIRGGSPDPVGEQPGQHVFTAEQDLPLVGEVPEERGTVQAGAIRDLRDGRFLVPVLDEQVQRGSLQALTRVGCPSAHRHSLGEATGSHHLAG